MIHARPDYNRIIDPSRKIPQDEPVILIRGQDILAIPILTMYIRLYEQMQGDPVIIKQLRAHIARIMDWQAFHAVKLADLPRRGL